MTAREAIAQAACRALGILALLYLVVVHLYVAWKLDTVGVDTINQTVMEQQPAKWYESAEYLDHIKLLQRTLTALEDEIAEAAARKQQVQDLTRQVVTFQQEVQENQGMEEDEDVTDDAVLVELFASYRHSKNMHPLTHLEDLFRHGLDSHATNDDLIKAFRLATHDLQQNILVANKVDWVALSQAMPKAPAAVVTTPDAAATVAPTTTITCNHTENELTKANLEARVNQIRQTLRDRWNIKRPPKDTTNTRPALPLIFPATVERLETARKQRRQEQIERVQTAAVAAAAAARRDSPTDENDNMTCIRAEQVVPWLEAGLDALYRRTDLRRAVLGALQDSGVDTDGIILDAALAPAGRTNMLVRQAPTNVRQLLEKSPLLKERAVTLINAVTDLVSGYNDHVDQFLDSLTVEGDLGRSAVDRILLAAARVKLPDPLRQQMPESLMM